MLSLPFGSMLSTLTREEIEDVELAHLLLAAAEMVGYQQYDRASRLLGFCDRSASIVGNPVQRVVHHFAGALRERIDRETGRRKIGEEHTSRWAEDVDVKMRRPHPACLASYRYIPFSQIMNLTEIRAILGSVASSNKIHLIDLGIRIGFQWTSFMQALSTRAACPVNLLRITAVGTCKQTSAKAGHRLVEFAKTLSLPFVFEQIIVQDMEDLTEDKFKEPPEADESVAVYASLVLRTMIDKPDCLENVMRIARRLAPCLMIVTEVDGNHNSLSFSNRFIEALFFYSAWFDCLGDCMSEDDHNRLDLEANFFSPGIRSIVATEGRQRVVRHVGMDVWRSFLSRFGSVEMELSQAILYQASLTVKQFACGSSCTVDMRGNCLTIGWKGTPMICVSAWKLD